MEEAEYTENQERQEAELSALEAIYAEDCAVWLPERRCEVYLPSRGVAPYVVLRALLPAAYPSQEVPQIDIEARHLDAHLHAWLMEEIRQQMEPGGEVLFTLAEWIKEQEVLFASANGPPEQPESTVCVPEEPAESQRGHDSDVTETSATSNPIVTGVPFVEKKSTFQAHLSAVNSVDEVQTVMEVLLSNNKIRNATHNIMAYRIHCEDRNTFLQDNDDDGENAAGGRLAHLLQLVDARNVLVVVSRWYGGVKLGPARFTHINNAARELLLDNGYIAQQAEGDAHGKQSKSAGKKRT